MPKSSKPRGGRPARNFDPRYAQKKTPFHERHTEGGRRTESDRSDADTRGARSDSWGDARGGAPRGGARAVGRPSGFAGRSGGVGRPTGGRNFGRDENRGYDRGGRDDSRGYSRDGGAAREGGYQRDGGFAPRGGRDDSRGGRGFDRDNSRGFSRDGGRGAAGYDRDNTRSYDRGGRDEFRGYERDNTRSSDRGGRDDFRSRNQDDNRSAVRGPGARSPKHRGYRPEETAAEPKRRWGAPERAGRDEARSIRGRAVTGRKDSPHHSDSFDDRRPPRTEARPARGFVQRDERGNRPPRSEFRGEREQSSFRGEREQSSRQDFRDDRARESRPKTREVARNRSNEVVDDVVHERLEAQQVLATETADVSFGDLGLGSNIVETLAALGAAAPFPIQAASIPAVMEGRDVLARGRTGSGKTIAFGAPLVERVLRSQSGKRREFGRAPKAIILAPTRELALQIDRTIQPIARSVGLFTTQVYGGVPQGRQVGALRKGVDIVIGTPGRVEDLINQRKLDLRECDIAVLDEADHMCELGFVEPVQRILRHTADGSQKLLFSATLDREVEALVKEFLVKPAVFEIAGETQESSTIDHRVLVIEHREKSDILTSLVDRAGKTLVFARTRAFAEMLAEQFDDAGIPAVSLHGDLNQAKRTRNLEKLTSGRVNVLVATDVAARGIHVDDIDLVVQADAPDEYKTYLHRSGRTGRAGRAGRVVTLITRHRRNRMLELLERAEIDAPFDQARLGDEVLEEVAGRMTLADLTA